MEKTVCITGVGRGLGRALFDECVARGFQTFGVLRDLKQYKDRLKDLDEEKAHLILADLLQDSCMDKIKNAVKGKKVDLVINNAGVPFYNPTLQNQELEDLRKAFEIHCLSSFKVIKALRTNLIQSENATIINVSSRLSSLSGQNRGLYSHSNESYAYPIAKAAQNMLSVCLRKEFQGAIKVIALHPGKLKTEVPPPDADLLPEQAAKQIIDHWLAGHLVEEDGIWDLQNGLIPW